MTLVASALEESEGAVRNLALTMNEDYQVEFVSALWGDAFEAEVVA